MNRRVRLTMLAIAIILSGCTPMVGGMTAKTPQGWAGRTATLVATAARQTPGGVGGLLGDQPPSLYETYYDVQALRAAGFRVPRQRALQSTIRSLLSAPIPPITTINELLTLRYLIGTAALIHVAIPAAVAGAIVTRIGALSTPQGAFTVAGSTQPATLIVATEAATRILAIIGHPLRTPRANVALAAAYNHLVQQGTPYVASLLTALYEVMRVTTVLGSFWSTDRTRMALQAQLLTLARTRMHQVVPTATDFVDDVFLLRLLHLMGSAVPPVSAGFVEELRATQTPDGGYSLISRTTGDPQFTMQVAAVWPPARRHLRIFDYRLLAAQLPDGLFTSRVPLPPSLASNYLALRVLSLLGAPIPQAIRHAFGQTLSLGRLSWPAFYDYLRGQQLLGHSLARFHVPPASTLSSLQSPTAVYRLLSLVLLDELSVTARHRAQDQIVTLINRGIRTRSLNLQQLALLIRADRAVGGQVSPHWVAYVHPFQHANGGFGRGHSSLIGTYYAVQIYSALHTLCPRAGAVRAYVMASRLLSGGFSLVPATGPSLAATYWGVVTLTLLGGISHVAAHHA
jgi:hypothetical protein